MFDLFRSFVLQMLIALYALVPAPTYTEGVFGQPQTFIPFQASIQTDKTISKLLYRGLFKYDIYGALVPDLAETWSVSEDGLVYTIKLKPHQKWSNGKNITSDDLIYTAFNDPDLSGVGTDRVDDLTVRYILPNKYAPFISLLTLGVVPSGALKSSSMIHPVSSGEFTVGRIEKSGAFIKRVVLVGNNPKHEIKKLVFSYYPDEDQLLTAAKLGEIDGFVYSKEVDLPNFYNYKFPLQGIYYALFFNLRDEKFQDLALRQNMEKVLPVKELTNLLGINVEGAISRSVFTDKGISFDKYDDFFETVYSAKSLVLTVPDIEEHVELAKAIKGIWEDKLGLDVTIRKMSPEDMAEKVIKTRNFEVLLYGQEVGRDPDRYVNWHSTQKDYPGLNVSGFEQVRADRALEEGRNELDNDKRVVHYNEFQKSVSENVPTIFLYHPYVNYYVSRYVSGIGEKYTFTHADRFLDFFNWKRLKTN